VRLGTIVGDSLAAVVTRLEEMVARINHVWTREHYSDGTHAIPKYISAQWGTDLGASYFTATGGGTFTVASTGVLAFNWWKHGDTLHLGFSLTGTVAGATNSPLMFTIPGGFVSKSRATNPVYLIDAGTRTMGLAFVNANSTQVEIYREDAAQFTAGPVHIDGQITFRAR